MRPLSLFFILWFVLVPIASAHAKEKKNPDEALRHERSFHEILNAKALDTFKIDRGLERSDLAANYLLLMAREQSDQGFLEEALRIGEEAIRFSPASPMPHFFISKIIWQKDQYNPESIRHALSEILTGISLSIHDFWLLFSVLGTFFLLMITGFFLSLLTFTVYTLISLGPLWAHQLREWSRGVLHPGVGGLILAMSLTVPLFLGLSVFWFFIFCFFIFWGFYRKTEKGIVVFFLIGLGASAWVVPGMALLLSAKHSTPLRLLVLNQQSEFIWSYPVSTTPVETDLSWEALSLRASYEIQEGNTERGEEDYRKALALYPSSGLILNNLGNLFFYRGKVETAIQFYQDALRYSPKLISSSYNLGQVSQQMPAFREDYRRYLKDAYKALAKNLDPQAAGAYKKRIEVFPAFPVVEERFTKKDLWMTAWNVGRLSGDGPMKLPNIGEIMPSREILLIALSGLFLVGISSLLLTPYYQGWFCFLCHRAVCGQCEHRILSYSVCEKCEQKFSKIDYTQLNFVRKRVPWSSYLFFLIPGGGDLTLKKSASGMVYMFCFYFLVSWIYLGEILLPPTAWPLSGLPWIVAIPGITLLYGVSFFNLPLMRRHRR